MPYYGGTSDVASEDDPLCNQRSEHASEFKILIQSTHSEEPYEDEDLLSPGSAGRSSRRFLVLLACTIVGFVMNVLVSVVAPFFPAEAKRLTGTNNTVIGLIFAIFPLTSLVVAPIINLCIRRLGRKWTLCGGLLTLSLSTLGFGLSTSIPLWGVTRVLQGAGSAAAGATYYAILSDMYTDNLGFVIGIQEAVTGLGYMVGPMLGAGLYSLGGFRLPFLILGFFPLAVCLMLPPLLRDAHNFDPSHNLPYTSPSIFGEDDETSLSSSTLDAEGKPTGSLSLQDPPLSTRLGKKSSPYLSFPFIYVSLGTTLATCGFAFLEPVLSEHLMNTLHVSTSTSGLLMGLPSITYIIAAPLGGWLGEVCGYRPILFLGFLIFAVGLALVGPMPLVPVDVDLDVQWVLQVLALGMLGVGSAFGTITTMPDLKHIAGPGTTDDVACIFNNVLVPAGEVMGPLIGGVLTQLLGFRWAAFSFGCLLFLYGLLLLLMHFSGHLSWAHHREEEDEAASYLLDRRVIRVGSQEGIECSYASLDTVGEGYQHLLAQDGLGDDQSDADSWEPQDKGEEQEDGTQIPRRPGSPASEGQGDGPKQQSVWLSQLITSVLGEHGLMEKGEEGRGVRSGLEGPRQ